VNNKYYRRWEISEVKFRQLVRYFVMDFTASDTDELMGLSRRSVTDIYGRLRQKIALWSTTQAPLEGAIEVDESYFGPKQIPGKPGRGGRWQNDSKGIFKRQGKVYTEIVPDARKKTLQRVIRGKVNPQSIIHIDGWRGYDGGWCPL